MNLALSPRAYAPRVQTMSPVNFTAAKEEKLKVGIISFMDQALSANDIDEGLEESEKAIEKAITDNGDEIVRINPEECQIKYSEKGIEVLQNGKPLKVDAALFYGAFFSENQRYAMYSVMDALKENGTTLLDSTEALQITDDKLKEAQLFAKNHLPIPKTDYYGGKFVLSETTKSKKTVLKNTMGYCGEQVVHLPFKDAARISNVLKDHGKQSIFQDFVKGSSGKSIRVVLVDGKPLYIGEYRAKSKTDFRSNTADSVYPVTDQNKIKSYCALAQSAAQAIPGLTVAGVDILEATDKPYVLEVNSSPDFLEGSTLANADVAKEIADHLHAKSTKIT